MILCKDCRHCRPARHYRSYGLGGIEWETYEDARCVRTDLVTGTGEAGRPCVAERDAPVASSRCGPLAQHFEARP